MRMRKGLLALTVAAGVASLGTAANADGYVRSGGYRGPAPFSWTGFYIGGHAGGAWSVVDWDNVSLTGESVNNDGDGFMGGGQIGYNWQVGSVVLGIEGTYSGADLSGDFTSVVNPVVTYSTDINHIFTLTGRLGFTADKLLVYAKAGWATAEVEVSGNNPAIPDSFSIDDRRHGWTVGAGLEYMVSRNLSLAAEYSYIDLGNENYSGTTAVGIPFTVSDVDTQIHSVTGRLNFHFHRDEYHHRPLK